MLNYNEKDPLSQSRFTFQKTPGCSNTKLKVNGRSFDGIESMANCEFSLKISLNDIWKQWFGFSNSATGSSDGCRHTSVGTITLPKQQEASDSKSSW